MKQPAFSLSMSVNRKNLELIFISFFVISLSAVSGIIIWALFVFDPITRIQLFLVADQSMTVLVASCYMAAALFVMNFIVDIRQLMAPPLHSNEAIIRTGFVYTIRIAIVSLTPLILSDVLQNQSFSLTPGLFFVFVVFLNIAAIGVILFKVIGRVGILLLLWYEISGQIALWLRGYGYPGSLWMMMLIGVSILLFIPPVNKIFINNQEK